MKLTKLFPKKASFHLSAIDKDIHLLPATVGRLLELTRKFGEVQIDKVLSNPTPDDVIKIVFFLMTNESKQLFKMQEYVDYDIEGREVPTHIGGVKLLLRYISTADEYKGIVDAVQQCFGGTVEVKKSPEQVSHSPQ